MLSKKPTSQKDRLLSSTLWLIAILTCLKVWIGPFGLIEPASAQIPDSGAQRKALLDESRRTNQLLGEIKQFLANGTLNVRIQGADNQSGAPAKGRRNP